MMDKKPHIKPYLYGMFAGFGAISLSILFFFLIYRFQGFGNAVSTLTGILMPFIYGMSGWLYLVAALGLNAGFIWHAFKLWQKYSDALARKTFRFSLIHLALLFAALLVDHYFI